MDELTKKLDDAREIISGLMTLCEDREDYHGNGTIDRAYEWLRDDEVSMEEQ